MRVEQYPLRPGSVLNVKCKVTIGRATEDARHVEVMTKRP